MLMVKKRTYLPSTAGQCSVPILGQAQPFPAPLKSHDGGEVMRLLSTVWVRQVEGVMADPGLSVWPSFLGLAGPRSFRPSLANAL